MSGTPTWRPLPSTPTTGVPPLLVSMEVGASDYTVRVTDMANIWSESLDRRSICRRAWDQNTSIDPSDTPENMTKFISSIQTALDSSQSGHEDTTVALSPSTGSESSSNGLVLKTSCKVPGLQTLRWTMNLTKEPVPAIATNLVLPLIETQLAQKLELEALEAVIRQKDSVITKLLDKLEATGTGLEHIFTALSGRKRISRAAAGDKVRGIAPFEVVTWRKEIRAAAIRPTDVPSLLTDVFSGRNTLPESAMEVEQSPILDEWWHNFTSTTQVPHRSRSDKPVAKETPPPAAEQDGAEEDDFQVQSTPPRLNSKANAVKGGIAVEDEDVSTASEAEEGSPIQKRVDTSKSMQKGPSKIGTIGGKKNVSKSPSPPTAPEPAHKTSSALDRKSDTASGEDDDGTASLLESPPPPAPQSAAKKGGLGRIGGRQPSASQEDKVPRHTSPERTLKSTASPKKLGVIGKRAADKVSVSQTPTPSDSDHLDRGRTRHADDGETGPRETSQDRANRKRDELKKELEKKAAAGPVKKKRKF